MGQSDIHFYTWMFLRRLPFIIVVTVVGAAIGLLVALSLTPTYRAVAKILVESPRISSDLARSTVQTDPIEQLQIVEQRLTTRDSLVAMAHSLDIYPDISALDEATIVKDMRSRTALEPVVFSSPRGGSGALLVAVSFEASDPTLAARVANSYAATILERNAKLRKDRATDALEFIRGDVDRLAKELSDTEAEITAFTNDHRDALPDSLEFRRAQQASQQQRLMQIERDEASLRSRRRTLVQIYAHTSGIAPAGLTTPEDQMIADLRRALTEQRAIFTETSPNIVALRQRIETLEAELQAKRSDTTQEADPGGMPPELRLQLVDIDSQLKFLATEKEAIDQNLADLDRTISATVENGTVLKRLQIAYENAQSQYNDAQQRLAEASTGARIEQESVGEKLTLMEPAVAPDKPYGPRRRYVVAGGGAGGFALGFAIVFLLELWRGAVYRPADISRVFDGEPLVAVPYIRSPAEPAGTKFLAGLLPAFALLIVLQGGSTAERGCTPGCSTVSVLHNVVEAAV